LRDVVLAPLPLDRDAAMALLGRLKGAAVLGPYRGMAAADTEALADLMVRLSQFALDHAEAIAQIDLNPVIVHSEGDGVSVVDALIIKHPAQQAERRSAAE
jgi:acetyltransferase